MLYKVHETTLSSELRHSSFYAKTDGNNISLVVVKDQFFSVLLLFSGCQMANQWSGLFHAKIQYKTKRCFFMWAYM